MVVRIEVKVFLVVTLKCWYPTTTLHAITTQKGPSCLQLHPEHGGSKVLQNAGILLKH